MSKIVLGEHSWRSDERQGPCEWEGLTLTEAEAWQDSASSPALYNPCRTAWGLRHLPHRPDITSCTTWDLRYLPHPQVTGSSEAWDPASQPEHAQRQSRLIPALRPSGKQKPGLAGGGRARKEKEAKSRSLAFWPDFLGKERCGRSVCARREGLQARWRAARAPDARPGSRAGSGRRRPHNGVISASALQRPPLPARSGTDCPGAPRLRTHSLALGRQAR